MSSNLSQDRSFSRATVYQHSIDLNNLNDPRKIIFDLIKDKSEVLDVGCACGDLGIVLQDKKCRIFGLDHNNESLTIAKKTNAYEKLWQLNLEDLVLCKKQLKSYKFDYLVFSDVIEHINNAPAVLDFFSTLLKPNGSFLISLPNVAHASIKANLLLNYFDYTTSGLLDETHQKLFTYHSIAQLMTQTKLAINQVQFTTISNIGFQPRNPYPTLDLATKKTIFRSLPSFVCQYVFQARPTTLSSTSLLAHNLGKLTINHDNAGSEILAKQLQTLRDLQLRQIFWKKLLFSFDEIRKKLKIKTRFRNFKQRLMKENNRL